MRRGSDPDGKVERALRAQARKQRIDALEDTLLFAIKRLRTQKS